MFTVTMHFDRYPTQDRVLHTCETYAEAYEWARKGVRPFAELQPSGYPATRCIHDDETWMDRWEAWNNHLGAPAYAQRGPEREAWAEIACDDLEAWHAAVMASEYQSAFSC